MSLRSPTFRIVNIIAIALLIVSEVHAQENKRLDRLANRFVQQQLEQDPTLAYQTGVHAVAQDRFADRTAVALQTLALEERNDLRNLNRIHVGRLSRDMRPVYASLREQLEEDLQIRVCRKELWDVDHFDGWQIHLAEIAERQAVETDQEKRQAIQRWSSLPRVVDVEISNLRLGLDHGYSAPRSVVQRVIREMDDLTSVEIQQSIFYSPVRRSNDATFRTSFMQLIGQQVNPALQRYRNFLEDEYLPRARDGVAVSELPNGAACYQAFLRANTTLRRTPKQIFTIGQKAVSANLAEVQRLGLQRYGVSDPALILKAVKSTTAEHFSSRDELLSFSQTFLDRSKELTSERLVATMPKQDVVIRALSVLEESSGGNSRFQSERDAAKPAVYLINLGNWRTVTRSEAEIATVHETTPGHYLQHALASEWQRPTALSKFLDNAGYSEGWARYAEGMAEEVGTYDTGVNAAILRRMWPARGMVVDPGIHAFGWTRQQAIDYIVASGRFTAVEANDYVDRIAVAPGQLTSYDTGALEIAKLRATAQVKLGQSYNLKSFNRAILEEGNVPLGELHVHIADWIVKKKIQERRNHFTCCRSEKSD